MESSPRLFQTASRIVPEAGSQIPDAAAWHLQEDTSEGTPIPEPGDVDPHPKRLPSSGSWLHAYSPSEHTYPCDDDGFCGCAHCVGEPCDCEECSC